MIKLLLAFFGTTALLLGGLTVVPHETTFGAFGDPFLSIQLAASPANGECLTTNGTDNDWGSCGGSSSSAFEIATTSDIAVPGLSYFTKTTGRTTLGSVATTTLTASSPLSLSNPVAKVGGTNSVLTIDTSGAWTGTAGSLAANGGNCSAGNFPLGVDALGAVETCTDAWTEAENTSANYASSAFTIATTTGLSISQVAYITKVGGVTTIGGVATGTVSAGNGISLDSSVRSVLGGALAISNSGVLSNVAGSGITVSGATGNVTVSTNDRDDIATSTGLTISELAYYTKTGGLTTLSGVATTSATCTGSATCDPFTVLGSTPITINATGGSGNTTWETFSKGYIAPTTTVNVAIGATSTAHLNNSYFQVNATSTTGNLITASSTAGFTGNFLKLENSAGTDLFTVDSAGEVRGAGASGGASFVFAPASLQENLWKTFEGNYLSISSTVMTFLHTTGVYQFVEDSGALVGALDFRGITTSDKTFTFPNFTGTVGVGVATTTSSLAYWQSGGALNAVATTTLTASSPLSLSQAVVKVGGTNSVLSIATTTNSLFTGTPGQVLGYTNLGWVGVATTTAGTGLTYTGSAFNVNTTQNITALSNLTTNALIVTSGGNGTLGAYAGIDCTNQFVRDVAATGAGTCATVGAADVSLANLTATDTTLTFSGTYTGATARTIGLNLGNANTWTALQTHTMGAGVPALVVSAGLVGIGTTTPKWSLQIASSTGSQLTLSDGSLTSDHWSFRSINGNFFLATSSSGAFSTSTYPALSITSGIGLGNVAGRVGIATSSPWRSFSVYGDMVVQGTTTATSTIFLNSTAAGKGGSIILEDEGGAACTEITTKAGTITGRVVTCPP